MAEDRPIPARGVVAADAPDRPAADDRARLPYDARWLRREVIETEGGLRVLVDLPEARVLTEGEMLTLEDGRAVEILAAAEPLAEIRPRDAHHLARLAWHLGNRHLPTRIEPGRLLIRRDHVIEEMLALLGAEIAHVEGPFDPEGGAYGHGQTMGHAH